MKRSQVVMLLAGGTSLAGIYAYGEVVGCRPDPTGAMPFFCPNIGLRSSASALSGRASSTEAARGGFGGTGAAHGAGGE
jgi:hypothetical protein